MFKFFGRSGATANAIKTEFETALHNINTEKPHKVVKVGEHLIGMKPTDSYFVAIVMAFFMVVQKQKTEEAFTHAINLFADQVVGESDRSEAARKLYVACIEWHHLSQSKDAFTSNRLITTCRKFVDSMIEKVGQDVDQSIFDDEMEKPKLKTVKTVLQEQEDRLKTEKPILIIDLGTRKAPLKPSDFQFIAMIMAFAWKYDGMSQEDALHYSILTFVLTKAGTEQEKKDANETASSAFKWDWDIGSNDLAASLELKLMCAHLLKKHFGMA